MDAQPGKFHWNELMTRDLAGAKAFYSAVCGWSYDEMEVDGMSYTLIMAGGEPAGGIFEMDRDFEFKDAPVQWIGYVEVEDPDAACAAAAANGGVVIKEPFDVTGVGRIGLTLSKEGAFLGVIKPAPQPMEG
jgi:predicted enzyme related to lactoylglutathione lyase